MRVRGISRGMDSIEDLPRCIDTRTTVLPFYDEREFHLFLRRSQDMRHALGWGEVVKDDPFFPDIGVVPLGAKPDEVLYVELEYEAKNFRMHRHSSTGCDLIVCFMRRPGERVINGVPVWSLYEKHDGILYWCLQDDIQETNVFSPGFIFDETGEDV